MKQPANRPVEIAGFLAQCGWEAASHEGFAADFSPRRYARLIRDDGLHAVLMDADEDQKTPEFVMLAKLLRDCGIHAPVIYAASPMQGLVLMEDMGNRNFGKMLDGGALREPLYRRAIDVLAHLHQNFKVGAAREIGLPRFDASMFASQAVLYLDAWFPYTKGRDATETERMSFNKAWIETLEPLEALPQSLLLRDFMPDNLIDVQGEESLAATGVLDFQDAGIGPIAYDIASLCENVRRDGGDMLLEPMIDYYIERTKAAVSHEELKSACVILSVQRHMRIQGILARLVLNGRSEKKAFLPRVRGYLAQLLADPVLEPVAIFLKHDQAY